MNDFGRNNLVTRFKCQCCGNQLELSYEKDKDAKGREYKQDNITGGNKVEVNIYIHPCKTCVEKPQRQLDTLREILK